MANYTITFTDPLKHSFSIPEGAYNGPGSGTPRSTLRLFGDKSSEWGEAVNEDLIRLAQNFAGATPPAYPLNGQGWREQRFYWRNTATSTWYRFNLPNRAWDIITGFVTGGVVGSAVPPHPAIGLYWYTPATAPVGDDAFDQPLTAHTLYRYDTAYKQQRPGWVKRSHVSSTVVPTSYTQVSQRYRVFNGNDWYTIAIDQPVRIDGSNTPMTGPLTLNATPTAALHAASKQYVDTQAATITPPITAVNIFGSLTTGTPKSGDIATVGGRGYVRVGGIWCEFFPACCV